MVIFNSCQRTNFSCRVSQQDVVPESALKSVKELFVPQALIVEAQKEAESLPTVDVTEVYMR